MPITLVLAILLANVPMLGIGEVRRAVPRSPCASGPSRQFDIWVGDWRVYTKFGVYTADSSVTTELDGCAVMEHWAPLAGMHGRSLNAYEAETGHWHQTWIPDGPPPAYPFRMAGGLRPDGVMAMSGIRDPWYARGVPFYQWRDAYTWTPFPDGSVVQAFMTDIDNFNVHSSGALTYQRGTPSPPAIAPPSPKCTTGVMGDTRRLDFTLGTWSVQAENGLPLATTTIALDPTLSGCLLEETFVTPKGYRATGWLYYDPVEDRFYRTIADTEGGWIELGGRFDAAGALVLQSDSLRITWRQVSDNRQEQLWETSRDGGVSWREEQVLVLTR